MCFAVNIYLGKQMYFCNTPLVAVNINEGLRHSNLDGGCLIKQRQAHYISFYFLLKQSVITMSFTSRTALRKHFIFIRSLDNTNFIQT